MLRETIDKKLIFAVRAILSTLLAVAFTVTLYFVFMVFRSGSMIDEKGNLQSALSQIKYISGEIHNGIAFNMQSLYPEGFLFTNVLYGLNNIELFKKVEGKSFKDSLLTEVQWALNEIDSETARKRFDEHLSPKYGAFYLSWCSWFRGKYLSALNPAAIDSVHYRIFQSECKEIVSTYLKDGNPFPESYRNSSWPADAIVGIASLKLSDTYFKTDYNNFIQQWLESIKHLSSFGNELLPHSLSRNNNKYTIETSRGSSQSLFLRFLYELDPKFAKKQYTIFNNTFVQPILGLHLVKEYSSNQPVQEDVDSGPIIWGFGSVANIITLGTAKYFNDTILTDDLNIVTETLGFPSVLCSTKRYLLGKLIIADLFILWSRISEPVTPNKKVIFPIHSSFRIYFYIVTIIFLLLLIYLLRKLWRHKVEKPKYY